MGTTITGLLVHTETQLAADTKPSTLTIWDGQQAHQIQATKAQIMKVWGWLESHVSADVEAGRLKKIRKLDARAGGYSFGRIG